MTEQYKIGDRFMVKEGVDCESTDRHGKDVVFIFAYNDPEDDQRLFVVEECYNKNEDYSSPENRRAIGFENYEWLRFDEVVPVVTSKAPESLSQQIDESLGLVTITLRLDKELVDKYKVIAYDNRTSIEVLMRNCLEGMSNLFGRK